MKSKKPLTNKQKIAQIIGSLSSKEHYFLVHTDSYSPEKSSIINVDPNLAILIYENDDEKTILSLICNFIENRVEEYPFWKSLQDKEKRKEKQSLEEYILRVGQIHLEMGHLVSLDTTIKELKKILRTQNIDGVHLYINQMMHQENAALKFIQSEANYFKESIDIPFVENQTNYIVYVPVTPTHTFKELNKILAIQVQRVFGKTVSPEAITITIEEEKGLQVILIEKDEKKIHSLSSKDKIRFTVKDEVLVPPKSDNTNILIVKGEGFEPKSFEYGTISHLKLAKLLEGIDPKKDWSDYGMMIDDFTLKSVDFIVKAGKLFKKSQSHSKHIVGFVIKEMHVFELQLSKIKQMGPFELKKIVCNDENNIKHSRICEKEIQERAKKTSIASFKGNLNSIKPILLYTSELQVKGTANQNPQRMYYILNQFLRNQHFCQVKEDEYSKWEYQFGCELIEQLRKIECLLTNEKNPLWRGVRYLPTHKKGDIIEFKQFISSSKVEQTAKQFAESAMFKIIKSYSGRCIKQFSFYQYEDEILFEPYTYFKVVEIQKKYQNQSKKLIPCYIMEEIKKQQLPRNVEVFVLWVDDQPNEGKEIWHSLKGVKKTTLMVQLLSTEQLYSWLNRHQQVLKDSETQFIMITDMTRIENGKRIQDAGVQGIKIFKKFKPDAPILVYIGWVEGTISKLEKNNLYPNKTIEVTCYEEDLQEFLKKNCLQP